MERDGVAAELYTFIVEVSSSNSGRIIGYLTEIFVVFPSPSRQIYE
jgi:hypothetical protein